MKSARKFYVGFNSFGTEYEFDYHWTVFEFDSKREREEWLEKNSMKDGKEIARAITSKEMGKILPCGKYETREFEFDHRTGLTKGIVYPW